MGLSFPIPIRPAAVIRSLSVGVLDDGLVKNVITPSSLFVVSAPASKLMYATSFPFHLPASCPSKKSAVLTLATSN